MPEAPLRKTEHGLVPQGDGWFVLNARDARWLRGALGAYCGFEGDTRFPSLGINLNVLEPGEPMAMYHVEDADQEDFLVLHGEALAIVEGEERPLCAWDLVHCPAGTRHVIVGAGAGPCVVLAVGTRSAGEDWGSYSVDEAAVRHGAGLERETRSADEAYARFPKPSHTAYREGWLSEL